MAWDVSAELESVAQPKGLLGGLTPHPRLEIFTFWMCICAHTYPSTNIHKGEQVTPPPQKRFYTPGWNLYHICLFWPAKDTSACVFRALLKTH